MSTQTEQLDFTDATDTAETAPSALVPEKPATEKSTTEKTATFEALLKKPRRVVTAGVAVPDENGGVSQLKVKFQALTSAEYDELIEKHPPTRSEKDKGAVYNSKTFPPAIVAAAAIEPRLSYDQAKQLQDSPEWASGEFTDLFIAAMRATNGGLDVPFDGSA